MATGASNAELAVLLVDARKGLVEQTRRHAAIVSLLGIRHVVLAVNKIDLVDFSEARFREIERGVRRPSPAPLAFHSVVAIPLSARLGDNVAQPQPAHALVWRPVAAGPSRDGRDRPRRCRGAAALSGAVGQSARRSISAASPARWRPGRVAVGRSGRRRRLRPHQPRGAHRQLRRRLAVGRRRPFGHADAGRRGRRDPRRRAGRLRGIGRRSRAASPPTWSGWTRRRATPGKRFLLKIGTATVPATLSRIADTLDVELADAHAPATSLALNAIGRVEIETAEAVAFDAYAENRADRRLHPDRPRRPARRRRPAWWSRALDAGAPRPSPCRDGDAGAARRG